MNMIRKICNWYFSKGALPYWCILFLDCAAVFISGLAVYYFRHGGMDLVQHFAQVALGLIVSLTIYILFFFAFHTFRGVIDRKSTRLNSSHANISYAVFCLKK